MTPGLALDGGLRVRQRSWPTWPRVTEGTQAILVEALHSRRWTVSGPFTGAEPYERRFAQAFAEFHEVPYCVPTCNGSLALVVALEGLGIGPGDEVLVPGLTWVACASAVASVGAVPVLVDVDEESLCISAGAAEAAISERTAAILAVHLFCSAADLDAFTALSARYGIPLIEDCSQAHGARWSGRRVGTFGIMAAFSFQQTKLLTSGEGGAVLTSDPDLGERMHQLRADGRRRVSRPSVGYLDIEELDEVQGHNYCLSELHAALLLEGLERLDSENSVRRANARSLVQFLDSMEGVRVQARPAKLDAETYYHLCLRLDLEAFDGASIEWIAAALAAELDLPAIEPVDRPLNANPLYDPTRQPGRDSRWRRLVRPSRFELPAATEARRTCLTIPHLALLGDESDMEDIIEALNKVKKFSGSCSVSESVSAAGFH